MLAGGNDNLMLGWSHRDQGRPHKQWVEQSEEYFQTLGLNWVRVVDQEAEWTAHDDDFANWPRIRSAFHGLPYQDRECSRGNLPYLSIYLSFLFSQVKVWS